jgi:hypothetical protein
MCILYTAGSMLPLLLRLSHAPSLPQVDSSSSYCAARAVRELSDWSKYAQPQQRLMCRQLARLAESDASLSDDTADAITEAADGCESE